MKGIKLDLTGSVPRLDLGSPVSGRDGLLQNASVNFVVERGSDRVFPERGTRLLSQETLGLRIDSMGIRHLCGFAATDTLTFTKNFSQEISEIRAIPMAYDEGRLKVDLGFRFSDGSVVGRGLAV